MDKQERGPDRRRGRVRHEHAVDQAERRNGRDRRRHGFISRLELGRGLPYAMLEPIVERCPATPLAAGETLLEPGQANHHLYFLLEGRLEIHLKSIDSPILDIVEVGECVGEMSIIDGEPVSAHVIASEPSTVLTVDENVFWSEIATSPTVMRNLSRVLAERMRKRSDVTLRALEREMWLEQLDKELAVAHRIQAGMLPPGPMLLHDTPALDVCSRMQVARTVGGDLYDAFPVDAERVCVVIGDVSGKGMPAALFMVQAVTLIRVEMNKSTDLPAVMTRINRALCGTGFSHMFVSLIIMVINTTTGELTYVNAGHPPFLIARVGGRFTTARSAGGLVAGVLEDSVYEADELTLAPGDRLLLYTDGVTEARGPQRRLYGVDRLNVFLNACSAVDATGYVDALFDDLTRFADGTLQSDDVTALAVTFRP